MFLLYRKSGSCHLRETPCELYHRMSWGIIAISLGYILQVLRTMLSTSKQLQKKRCCGNFWMQHTKVTKVSKAKIYPRPHILLENRHHLGLTSWPVLDKFLWCTRNIPWLFWLMKNQFLPKILKKYRPFLCYIMCVIFNYLHPLNSTMERQIRHTK